jgi:hypothetical protein
MKQDDQPLAFGGHSVHGELLLHIIGASMWQSDLVGDQCLQDPLVLSREDQVLQFGSRLFVADRDLLQQADVQGHPSAIQKRVSVYPRRK